MAIHKNYCCRSHWFLLNLLLVVLVFLAGTAIGATRAFPGAEGYGAYSSGGRGGDVYHVTTLSDSYSSPQPGMLRHGLITATGPRTIVFDVSGYIDLTARLEYSTDNITIAGQTAPGDGITIRHWDVRPYLADNGIIRYIRVRVGHYADQVSPCGGLDALSVEGCKKFIIDHVSVSWGIDEVASITGDSNDVTVQWSILAEPLNIHGHAYISLLRPAITGRYTHHHNLYTDCIQRLTRFGNYNNGVSSRYDWVNNVAYNWGNTLHPGDPGSYGCTYNQDSASIWYYDIREGSGPTGGTDGEPINVNFIKNYFIPYTNDCTYFFYGVDGTGGDPTDSKIWAESNYWNGAISGWEKVTGTRVQMPGQFPITSPLTIDTAPVAYVRVLEYAGNWLVRDLADTRIINEVITRTGAGSSPTGGPGILYTQDDVGVGGFPTLNSVSRPAGFDTDGDGMPNVWEAARWLSPDNAVDRNGDKDGDGYTNLEEYLNYLVLIRDGTPGDFDGDGDVDIDDLAAFLDDWLVEDHVYVPAGDLDGDYNVDFEDFAIFAGNWSG